ncbi:hypothetical protein MOQ_001313 [Trypanosoma cruzi marinkellei]|uniref:Uncharacterized protein n=1 Tax=Trypanosoma cruzi marinkellei TaxID=85056 RepID=K2MT98_TRYCR|nr:hypothetical protein MOQ_001313 [Trypanosoma cruzi marinkellei]
MKYVCTHNSAGTSQSGLVVSARTTKPPTCSSTILTLQRKNAALTNDLEECLGILRDARAFTDEVEMMLAAVPEFLFSMQQHMQSLMLLQHGVFLGNATVIFQLWHRDREALLHAFEQQARDAYESYQCKNRRLVEQHEMELEETHSEWQRTLDSTQKEMAELTRRLKLAEEDEGLKVKHMLLKKAAAVIERKRCGGCNKETQTSYGVTAVACQTTDVYRRSAAVQTTEGDLSWHQEPIRPKEEAEEKEPEPFVIPPVAFPAEAPLKSPTPREEWRKERQRDAMELETLRLEFRNVQMDFAHEREAAMTARSNCALLEETIQLHLQEITFLRDALDQIEAFVFLSPTKSSSSGGVTALERLALMGNDGLNRSPQVLPPVVDTSLHGESVFKNKQIT